MLSDSEVGIVARFAVRPVQEEDEAAHVSEVRTLLFDIITLPLVLSKNFQVAIYYLL